MAYVRHLTETDGDDPGQLELQSYAAYVMALSGKPDRALLQHLTELSGVKSRNDNLPGDADAMRADSKMLLACGWALAGRRDLAEPLIPAAALPIRSIRQHDGNLGSAVRDRAMLILTLEQVDPNRADLPDLVQQLADQGVNGQWSSTQDVAFAVLAIGRYLRDADAKQPYDSARVLAGKTVLAETRTGESLNWHGGSVDGSLHVEVDGVKDAVGHLAWVQSGVPLGVPSAAEHGLKIHRQYQTLDGQPIDRFIRSGELVRVELLIEAPPSDPNLVIEDLLPAGLEVENPRLETAAKDRDDVREQNRLLPLDSAKLDVRDDRVVIAGNMTTAGKARCTYLARAVTAGTYTIPPVRVEEMYDLNTNAISESGTLVITAGGNAVANIEK